jgi:hypothetical protein
MSKQQKIENHLEQIEWAGKANGSHSKTIVRMQDEYLQAMEGKSRKIAIKSFCSMCLGWERPLGTSIRECPGVDCPLHPYRPYQKKSDVDESDPVECTLSGINTP